MLNKKGFTLIELLIVVAIIAILAAIAIPNFLQAQVRSKVSAAKSNMRTVATGLESYYIDNNEYPPSHTGYSGTSGDYAANNYMVPLEITTPIAYISSYPPDPFDRYQTMNPVARRTLRYRHPGWGYVFNPDGTEAFSDISLYVPNGFPNDGDNYPTLDTNHWYRAEKASPVAWGLWSAGPDGDFESESGVQPCRSISWYDPTNGTVSNGNICRFPGGSVTN